MSKADWAGVSLPVMWNSAQAADTEMAWQQVTAWQRTYDLLLHHEGRLKACRDELTYAWPPERSPAATAFVEYIDGLLVSIDRAKQDAVENHRALALVLTSLSAAKSDMAKLKAEWDKHEAEDATMAKNLPNDLFASGENWQETLNEQARVRMAQNDQEVFEAKQKMVDLTPAQGGGVDGGDPFDPKGPERGGGSGGESGPSGGGTRSWTRPPLISAVPGVDQRFGSDGADLAGVPSVEDPSLVAPAPPLKGSGTSAPPFGSSVPIAEEIAVSSSRPPSMSRSISTGAEGGFAPPRRGAAGANWSTSHVGGVGSRVAGTRVSPVGGVIGGGGPHAAAGGMPIGTTGRTDDNGGPGEATATLEWEVAEGGVPVIEPEPERLFRLGPVIGVDLA